MVVGSFGSKVFEASAKKILTFKEFTLSSELDVESGDAVGKKPTSTIKGVGLLRANIMVSLVAALGVDVWSEVKSWFAVKDAAQPYPLVICGESVSANRFLLIDVGLSDVVTSIRDGAVYYAAATVKLEFREYLPPGAQTSTAAKSASSANSAKGVASSGSGSVVNPYKVATSTQKAAAKRTNTGM